MQVDLKGEKTGNHVICELNHSNAQKKILRMEKLLNSPWFSKVNRLSSIHK